GKHRVKVLAPGFFETELDVLAVAGRLSIVPVDLKGRPGLLRVAASPAGAAVWIDGRVAARTPVANPLIVSAGRHTVAVSVRGHRPISRTVDIERGAERLERFDLAPTAQRIAAHWTLA